MCIKDIDKIYRKVPLKPLNVRVAAVEDLQIIALITIIITLNIVTVNHLHLDLHNFWVCSDLIEKCHLSPNVEWVNQEILLLR